MSDPQRPTTSLSHITTMKSYLLLFALALPLLLSGCGKSSAPSSGEVKDYLNSQVPVGSPLEVTEVEDENFPEGDGRCSVKVKLTVRCKSDLYQPANVTDAIKAAGGDESAYQAAVAGLPNLDEPFRSQLAAKVPPSAFSGVMLTTVATKAGQEATAYAKLEADHEVDTWRFTTLDLQNTADDFTGKTADELQGNRLVLADSDEGQKLIADQVAREKDFLAQVAAARQQMEAHRQIQAQADAAKQQQLVQTLLSATAPQKSYLGTITSDGHSTQIRLTFTAQNDGGKSLVARLENPADPTQATTFSGTIEFQPGPDDRHPDLPIRLVGPPVPAIRKVLADPMLDMWIRDSGGRIWLKVDPSGALVGSSIKGWSDGSEFSLQPKTSTSPATSTTTTASP
jgi:hypothetical protein